MKKLFLMAAFVAGPILYAQQKPNTDNNSKQEETLKLDRKAEQARIEAQSSQSKAFNLSGKKAANKQSVIQSTEPKKTTATKVLTDESLN